MLPGHHSPPTQHVRVAPHVDIFYDIFKAGDDDDALKPWLLFSPSFLCDTSLCYDVLKDPHMLSVFNIISCDKRHHGRTKAPIDARSDVWTWAADLLIVLTTLDVGPVHVLGTSPITSEAAIRIALMAPGQILSICGWGAAVSTKSTTRQAILEVINAMNNPEDPEDWDEAVASLMQYLFDKHVEVTFTDRLAAALIRRHPPTKITPLANSFMELVPEANELVNFKLSCPMLVVMGEDTLDYNLDAMHVRIEEFKQNMPVEVVYLSDASGLMLAGSATWSRFRTVYLDWVKPKLNQLPISMSTLSMSPSLTPLSPTRGSNTMAIALARMSKHLSRPDLAKGDPWNSNSFSTRSPENVALLTNRLAAYQETGLHKFELIGGNAKESWEDASWDEEVPWKFSERFDNKILVQGRGAGDTLTPTEQMIVPVGFRKYGANLFAELAERVQVVST